MAAEDFRYTLSQVDYVALCTALDSVGEGAKLPSVLADARACTSPRLSHAAEPGKAAAAISIPGAASTNFRVATLASLREDARMPPVGTDDLLKHGKYTCTLLVVYVSGLADTVMLHTKKGNQLQKGTVFLSDDSSSPVPLTLWEEQCDWFARSEAHASLPSRTNQSGRGGGMSRKPSLVGDVVLLTNICVSAHSLTPGGLQFTSQKYSLFPCVTPLFRGEEHVLETTDIVSRVLRQVGQTLSNVLLERTHAVTAHVRTMYHASLLPSQVPVHRIASSAASETQDYANDYSVPTTTGAHATISSPPPSHGKDLTGKVVCVQECIGVQSVYQVGGEACRKWQAMLKQGGDLRTIIIWKFLDSKFGFGCTAMYTRILNVLKEASRLNVFVTVSHVLQQEQADGSIVFNTTPWTNATMHPEKASPTPTVGVKRMEGPTAVVTSPTPKRARVLAPWVDATPLALYIPACDVGVVVEGGFDFPKCTKCDGSRHVCEAQQMASKLSTASPITAEVILTLLIVHCSSCGSQLKADAKGVFSCNRCPFLPVGKPGAEWRYCEAILWVKRASDGVIVTLQISHAHMTAILGDIPCERVANRLADKPSPDAAGRLCNTMAELMCAFIRNNNEQCAYREADASAPCIIVPNEFSISPQTT